MNGDAHMTDAARRLDRLAWTLIAAIAAVVLAAPLVSNFYIDVRAFLAPAIAALLLASAALFYTRYRKDFRLASGCECTAQVVAFAAVAAPLSYLAASPNLPLNDAMLDHWDKALGLDWRTWLDWMNERPAVFAALRPIYLSLTLQMTTVALCLAFSGRLIWLRVYTLSFIFAALITIAVSAVLPAAGVWLHYGLGAADSPHLIPTVHTSWPVFNGLRDGTFRALVAIGSEGIITFPSLHAALAVIVTVALWPVKRLRLLALALNTAMLAATPVDGSHYFVDVFAGIAVAAVSLFAAHLIATAAKAGAERAIARGRAEKFPQAAAGAQ